MKLSVNAREWTTWRHWLLWWKADADELRPDSLFSRPWFGAALALTIGTLTAWCAYPLIAYCLTPYGPSVNFERGYIIAGILLAVFAVGWLALGSLMLRGWRWAAASLMALCTAEFLAAEWMSAQLLWMGLKYRLPYSWIISTALMGVLLWTLSMHVYYIALRVERRQSVTGGPVETPAPEQPPC